MVLGGPGHGYQGPGFGFVIMERSVADHTVRIRMSPGNVRPPAVNRSSEMAMERTAVEHGESTWEPGEDLCIKGTFGYTKFEQSQICTFEVTCNDATPPFTAVWQVEGVTLTSSPQTVSVAKTVLVANSEA